MYHKRKRRNFTNKTMNYAVSTELLEDMASREYHQILDVYHQIISITESAANELTNIRALDDLIQYKAQGLHDLVTWLSEERCEEWSETLSRLENSIHQYVNAYCRSTEEHNKAERRRAESDDLDCDSMEY